MKHVTCEASWPESWKLSHRFDQEEVWGRISDSHVHVRPTVSGFFTILILLIPLARLN